MVKLKRLKIDQFRNVTPGTELRFRDSFNVLLGKNGTGKTTLLNLIVSILSWNFSPLLRAPFSIEYDLEAPGARATIRLRNRLAGGTTPPDPGLTPDMRGLFEEGLRARSERYETSGEIILSGQRLPHERALKFDGSKLTLCELDGSLIDEWISSAPIAGAQMMWSVVQLMMFQLPEKASEYRGVTLTLALLAGYNLLLLQRFDESLEYLNEITHSEQSCSAHSLENKGQYAVSFRDGSPASFATRIQQQIQEAPDTDELRVETGTSGAEFLERVIQLLGFKSAKIRLQRTARRTEPQGMEIIDFGNMRFDFTKSDRSIINHTLLSYGQKRLLSFYYYLACNPTCVVADELVNGMHHEWIEACLNDLGERQSFLTSQNPLLLDYLGFESADEVRSSFVLCRSEQQGEREILRWENMTAEDAEGFFSAYQVGIQHVSEILRTRGLW
ncbi:AAA family ATPase [Hyalangium gracile]|uniref:AAA family ATPase n=1 Tax=Hyalangium gracile TaxID=394092 RepID=UPI001CCD34FB|nr:AAA family ATPase [Hyalangium gracile]